LYLLALVLELQFGPHVIVVVGVRGLTGGL
jgi:hypothetical protein